MMDTKSRSNGASSLASNINHVETDVKTLVQDAQALLTAAAALTGEKAEDLRGRGMHMLDQAKRRAGEVQDKAVTKSKELAHTADVYVKDKPWRSIAAAAGIGLFIGVLLGRR